MKQGNKHVEEHKAFLKAALFFVVLSGGCAILLIWAAKSEDSKLAEKIRQTVGIKAPYVAPAPTPPVVVVEAEPEPMPVVIPEPKPAPEPIPFPEISYEEITRSKYLWPQSLELQTSKKVTIRYQQQEYGYMEFVEGATVEVHALKTPAEVYCSINENFISLSIHDTNFSEWFTEKYADRYVMLPIPETEDIRIQSHALDTSEGEARFWTEMRLWCHKNYESISLKIDDDQLIFRWLPKEDAPIDFQLEAREIARTYLLIRAKLGGTENYAACEIRHPTTDELLGSSSIFIPRL
jgi:hypothetical protein